MINAHLKEILRKIEELSGIFRQEVSTETNDLEIRCDEIKTLVDGASSVSDINFLLERIDEIQSLLGLQRSQTKSVWKQNLNEMAIGLRDRLQGESSWKDLSQHFVGIFPDHISLPFLYNKVRTDGFDIPEELQISQKIPKVKNKRAEQRNPANLIKPIKVLSQTTDVDSHKQKMKICLDKLLEVCDYNESQPMSFFNFAINCESYVQTVYNIFTISFLIRERLAVMMIDKNHQLWIRPSSKSLENNHVHIRDSQNGFDDSLHQFIVNISPREWKMLIDRLGLTKSVLPVLWPVVEFLGNRSEFYCEITNGVHFVD